MAISPYFCKKTKKKHEAEAAVLLINALLL